MQRVIDGMIERRVGRIGEHHLVLGEDADRRPRPRRFGDPDEFGAACAFLCSQQAGYITGQSLLIDGGAYPGIL